MKWMPRKALKLKMRTRIPICLKATKYFIFVCRTPSPLEENKPMASNLQIKICGIKTPQTLEFTLDQGADMVGFMSFAKSPRHLEHAQINDLITRVRGHAQSAVVVVNPDMEQVEKISAMGPDFIQLHGHETPQFVADIIDRLGQKVIKVLSVGTEQDLADIGSYQKAGASLLLDAKPPKGASRPGGLGEVFDWSILHSLDGSMKYMLSGGLNPQNVSAAINKIHPYGIDVSSGVESAPGEKDHTKIKQFIANARAAQASLGQNFQPNIDET
ncbi:MAG TPA: phosphoribosylanthranilate isomerase [Devosia sp.]|nr:phosphoribosylanthranilate isomerase [Devosia sp.]